MSILQKFGSWVSRLEGSDDAQALGYGGGIGGGFSPFNSANNFSNTSRSYIFPPPLDMRKQIASSSREKLLENFHAMRNNIGLVKRLINGTARYAVADGIRPKSLTLDIEWNKQHDDWWEMTATNKSICDLEGTQDFYRAQLTVAASVPGEGEIFTNMVDPKEAGYNDMYLPLFQFIPAAGIKGARGAAQQKNVFDGLVMDQNNRVTAYRYPLEDGTFNDLSADNVIHTFDPERVGQRRGITWLYHGINSLVDILDLTALEKHAAKVHSALAAAVKSKIGAAGTTGLTGQLEALLTKTQQQQLNNSNPNARNQILEKIFGGGIIPFLNSDEELQLLTSTRPSAVFTGFLDWLVRDIAWGFGVSPEFIWSLAGMGGANTRTILADSQHFFDSVAVIVISWSEEVRRRRVSAAMIANQSNSAIGLPPCKDPLWMHKVHWKTPARITADIGKDGKTAIDLTNNGMNTWGDWWGGLGFNGRDKIVERVEEVAFAIQTINEKAKSMPELTYERVFPGTTSTKLTGEEPPDGGTPPSEKPKPTK